MFLHQCLQNELTMSSDVTALGRTGYHFSNWSGTNTCQPELYFEPESTDDIRQILQSAREKGKKVKVVGKGYSFPDLACTTDYLISLCCYNKVLEVDQDKHQVTVQGGCEVEELNTTILPVHGMALSVLGVVSDVTVAGWISTGTHGSGADYGTSSSLVVALDLMTASGEIIHISKEENSELLPAAVLSLGCLGVILTVTLQCQPAFNLHYHQYPAKLQDVLDNLDERLRSSDYFHIEAFPHTDGVVCHHASRTVQAPTQVEQSKLGALWGLLVGYHGLMFLLWLSTYLPRLMPWASGFYYRQVYGKTSETVDRSHRLMTMYGLPSHYSTEWAIPREKLGTALKELQSWLGKSGFPAHFPIFCRFGKREDIYLSPAYSSDICYINVIIIRPYNKEMPHEQYWEAIERIMSSLGGRPHWGKDHTYGGKDFQRVYPKWADFCRLRRRLDPSGIFLNSHLERIFGTHSGSSQIFA